MIGYLKLKSTENELYESEYLNELENKKTFISRIQYHVCKYYYKFLTKIKYYNCEASLQCLYFNITIKKY